MWHLLIPSSSDDSDCANHSCGVTVADDAACYVTLPCPISPCPAVTNAEGRCVFVLAEDNAVCAYCGRTGSDHK